MDKSDVDMEDAAKQTPDPQNSAQQSQNDSVDVKVEGDGKELPDSTAGEVGKISEVGAEDEKQDKGKDVADANGDKREADDLKVAEREADDLKVAESEAEDPNNGRREGLKEGEDHNNAQSDGVKEAEDPNNSTSEGVKEAEDQNNAGSEDVKEANDLDNSRGEGAKVADDVNNEPTEVKSEAEDRHNTRSEVDELSKIGDVAHGGNTSENGEECERNDNVVLVKNCTDQGHQPVELTANKAPQNVTGVVNEVHQSKDETMADALTQPDQHMADKSKESENKITSGAAVTDREIEMAEVKETKAEDNNTSQNVNENKENVEKDPVNMVDPANTVAVENSELHATPVTKREVDEKSISSHHEPATPNALVRCAAANGGNHSLGTYKNFLNEPKMPGDEDGTPEEQAEFMRELENFYRERAMEFKPPRFYGHQLNCLKLWRAVIRLGGYDRVTGSKLWRQVGESFHPPKTCTTVSWTFRIFYEKALLEYERYKRESGELALPVSIVDPSGGDNEGNVYQASGSGRARRDAASRAMQGWHAQRLFGSGEVGDPTAKDKNVNNMPKREKNLKSIGTLKQKRPNEVEHPVKAARTETSKQLVASVVDVGPPADWVKINVRETKECFEVYALVPGLLREEVRVQSDPAGRLVITGQPEQSDNPWGITAFKKVVSLPGRIDPLQTSAVVSLHGRLFVRVPFEQI